MSEMQRFIRIRISIVLLVHMSDETEFEKIEGSRMFTDDAGLLTSDGDIALHVMHRFNIDRDTMESMPAIDTPLKPLLWPEKSE